MAPKQARNSAPTIKILAEFHPLDFLWSGATPPYPSEQSARWAVRMHRAALAAGRALALSRGRLLVHPDRFVSVIEDESIKVMQRRNCPPGEPLPGH